MVAVGLVTPGGSPAVPLSVKVIHVMGQELSQA